MNGRAARTSACRQVDAHRQESSPTSCRAPRLGVAHVRRRARGPGWAARRGRVGGALAASLSGVPTVEGTALSGGGTRAASLAPQLAQLGGEVEDPPLLEVRRHAPGRRDVTRRGGGRRHDLDVDAAQLLDLVEVAGRGRSRRRPRRGLRSGGVRQLGALVGLGGDRGPWEGLRQRVVVQADVLAVERDPPHRAHPDGPHVRLELDARRLDPLVAADLEVMIARHALAQGARVDGDFFRGEVEALRGDQLDAGPGEGEDGAGVADVDAEDDLAGARPDGDAVGLRARRQLVAAARGEGDVRGRGRGGDIVQREGLGGVGLRDVAVRLGLALHGGELTSDAPAAHSTCAEDEPAPVRRPPRGRPW